MTDRRVLTAQEKQLFPELSTHFDSKSMRGPKMDVYTNELGEKWIDPLTPDFLRFLRAPYATKLHSYDGSLPITTLSYRYYGTTSLWYLILYANGYMHPHEIPSGAALKIPDPSQVSRLQTIKEVTKSGTTTEV